MYITTSRNPSIETRRFCKLLASILPNSIHENRGRKGIEEVAKRARQLGKTRALLVYEEGGKPRRLVFMSTGRVWRWLHPEIEIVGLSGKGKKVSAEGAILAGKMAGELAELFDFEPVECEEDVLTVTADGETLSFEWRGKQILLMKVVYRKAHGV
ncbi:MAG: hypothetical protein QXG98_04605 [Candidatus Micrarchaeia archaeon]